MVLASSTIGSRLNALYTWLAPAIASDNRAGDLTKSQLLKSVPAPLAWSLFTLLKTCAVA